ncbi:hypothetical protein B296_00024108 [Ensete ventricosum]|uniref:Uncharacterized protein n=1 Tax=Ensete ventricosum TaxID=4639 RepID=A0A427A2J9_ENSVE|nr:hypothetical protein B296_00024108 [Ensete ventricosum]
MGRIPAAAAAAGLTLDDAVRRPSNDLTIDDECHVQRQAVRLTIYLLVSSKVFRFELYHPVWRYVPVRQDTGTWTARYHAVPSKPESPAQKQGDASSPRAVPSKPESPAQKQGDTSSPRVGQGDASFPVQERGNASSPHTTKGDASSPYTGTRQCLVLSRPKKERDKVA